MFTVGFTANWNHTSAFWFQIIQYYVDTVGRNKKQIQEYIKNQLQEDQLADQMSIKEYIDPFTGSKETKA